MPSITQRNRRQFKKIKRRARGPADSFQRSDNAFSSFATKRPKLASWGVGLAAGLAMAVPAVVAGAVAATGAGLLAPLAVTGLEMMAAFSGLASLAVGRKAKNDTMKHLMRNSKNGRAPNQVSENGESAGKLLGKIFSKNTARNLAVGALAVGAIQAGVALAGAAVAGPLLAGGFAALSLGSVLVGGFATASDAAAQAKKE